jgi:hypothetical protein
MGRGRDVTRRYRRAVVRGLIVGLVTFTGWRLVPIGIAIGLRLVPFLLRNLLNLHDGYFTSFDILSVDVTIGHWPPLIASLLAGGAGLYLTWPRHQSSAR